MSQVHVSRILRSTLSQLGDELGDDRRPSSSNPDERVVCRPRRTRVVARACAPIGIVEGSTCSLTSVHRSIPRAHGA